MSMPYSQKELFLKLWLWSIIVGVAFVLVYWIMSGLVPFLQSPGNPYGFVDGVLYASVIGNALGAGLVGWRLVDKYKTAYVAHFKKRFGILTVLSFVLAFILVNTPLTFIMVLWTMAAPATVLMTFHKLGIKCDR